MFKPESEYESGQTTAGCLCEVHITSVTCLLCDIMLDLVFQSQSIYLKKCSVHVPIQSS